MKRYDLEAEDCQGGWASRDVMIERTEGDWVRYEDAAARIAELEHTLANTQACRAARNLALAGEQGRSEQSKARFAELEAAIDKLAAGKGRYHTEANYLALIAVRNKSLHK